MVKFIRKGIESLGAITQDTGRRQYTFFNKKALNIIEKDDIEFFRTYPDKFEEVNIVKTVKKTVEKVVKKKATKKKKK